MTKLTFKRKYSIIVGGWLKRFGVMLLIYYGICIAGRVHYTILSILDVTSVTFMSRDLKFDN